MPERHRHQTVCQSGPLSFLSVPSDSLVIPVKCINLKLYDTNNQHMSYLHVYIQIFRDQQDLSKIMKETFKPGVMFC